MRAAGVAASRGPCRGGPGHFGARRICDGGYSATVWPARRPGGPTAAVRRQLTSDVPAAMARAQCCRLGGGLAAASGGPKAAARKVAARKRLVQAQYFQSSWKGSPKSTAAAAVVAAEISGGGGGGAGAFQWR